MNPIRKTTTEGAVQRYDFSVIGTKFLVKNMSGGDILAGFEPDLETEGVDGWLIPDGAWQVIPGAESQMQRQSVYIKAYATSQEGRGVEIEAIEYRLPRI